MHEDLSLDLITRGKSIIIRDMTSNRPMLAEDYTQLQWMNVGLMKHLAGDVAIASVVTFGVAPIISVIDKSIVQRAAGTHSIVNSMFESATSIVRSPVTFVRSPAFLLMWGVYGSTFATGKFLSKFRKNKSSTCTCHLTVLRMYFSKLLQNIPRP